jgi:tRNA nucleotidyltransferase (CCA-adding enzyme)
MNIVVEQRTIAQAIPPTVQELCTRISDAGFGVWCVGGAVRDVILAQLRGTDKNPSGDWDLASSATPDQIMRLFRRVVPSGIKHGTVTVLIGDHAFEVTTLRGERGYEDGRHPSQVVFLENIVDDLARRDFTINAIAYDPTNHDVIDPYGGINDIHAECIRAVGDPAVRFAEDGLRVLRAARFSATLEMKIAPETLAAIRPSLASYSKVSAERIRDEWVKALKARQPSRAFRIMQEQGLLQITAPELELTYGCVQNRYHRYDVWEHTLQALDGLPASSVALRLAALLHDVGKPTTRAIHPQNGDYTFHRHEFVGSSIARDMLRRMRFPNEIREQVTALVEHHVVAYDSNWTDAAVRRWLNRVGSHRVADILSLARADVAAKGIDLPHQVQYLDELQTRIDTALMSHEALSLKDLRISGSILINALGLTAGPLVGNLLRALLDEVLEAPELNEPERLLDRARELVLAENSKAQ